MTQDCKITSSFFEVVTSFELRHFVDEDGIIWFVGKDVANILGYVETAKAVREHVDEDDKGVSVLDTPGGKQEMTIINESGLYSLILSSKLPAAKKFKRWVTSEVLPSIRKHGYYKAPVAKMEYPPKDVAVVDDDPNIELQKEKFIVEAWTWLENVLDTQYLSASEQIILMQWIKIFYKNFLCPLEISAHMLAKAIKKDERTVKKAILKLTQKKLYPPPFNLADIYFA